uniref:Uncharacterized protein n=1 Tax=Anguilla anguilla TaxID=7936 RepID=A0A0E9SB92_ANGAN
MHVCVSRAVKDFKWLAEATYTGEALQFSLTNMIDRLKKEPVWCWS